MPSTRTSLEIEYKNASERRENLESARAKARRDALSEFTTALEARLEREYGEQIRQAREEENRISAAMLQEKEEAALGKRYPYPLGSMLVEWAFPPRLYRAGTPRDRKLTGRKGVLEVITLESGHPANISSWRMAKRGDLVVRILKKDGTKSLKYVRCRDRYDRDKWVPEGTDLLQPDLSWPKVEPEGEAQP